MSIFMKQSIDLNKLLSAVMFNFLIGNCDEARRRIADIIDAITATISTIETTHHVQKEVAKLIKTRCENFIS
jgi:hypothetical protein